VSTLSKRIEEATDKLPTYRSKCQLGDIDMLLYSVNNSKTKINRTELEIRGIVQFKRDSA
jgi:hypothetical protein